MFIHLRLMSLFAGWTTRSMFGKLSQGGKPFRRRASEMFFFEPVAQEAFGLRTSFARTRTTGEGEEDWKPTLS